MTRVLLAFLLLWMLVVPVAAQNPSAWHPGATLRAYERHVATILRRMAKAEFLWKQI